MGVAVASGSIAVGSRVPWCKYGVGCVATQAYTNPSLAPLILQLIEEGVGASGALQKALAGDEGREYRQVAVMDWRGCKAVYTGSKAPLLKSSFETENCIAIANLVSNEEIPESMCVVFEENLESGLANALLKALEAGHEKGGDKRGDRSAAILVVGRTMYGRLYDKILDLRVDYSRNPLHELVRIYELHHRL